MRRRRLSLAYVGLHPRTLRAYRLSIDRFLKFLRKRRLPLKSSRALDLHLAEFIDVSYQEGEPLSYAGHLLSAIKRFHPELRLVLPRASQLLRNWQRCYVPSRAVPASWPLVEAMMGIAFSKGNSLFALLLAFGFNCLLRTNEMLSLTHKHVVFHGQGNAISLVLPGSKTSQGNPQVLLVSDLRLVSMARSLVRPGSGSLLWPHGPHQFRQFFASCLTTLHFQEGSYTPYCLRTGGATWYFQTTLSLDATVTRGRWSCAKTARQYIDEGTAQLAQVAWTRSQQAAVRQWSRFLLKKRLRQSAKFGR